MFYLVLSGASDILRETFNPFTDGTISESSYHEPTIEEYRAGKYDRTHMGTLFAKVLPFMILYIPLSMFAIDYAWDKSGNANHGLIH